MRRSTPPTEILLGFAAGAVAAFFVEQPLLWFLHHFGLTAREAYSTYRTMPLGVEAIWSRTFWGGAFGAGLAWFGTRFPLGTTYLGATALVAVAARTVADWFVVPMFYGHAWVGWSFDGIVTPLLLNSAWAMATAVLTLAFTLAAGTWGTRTIEM